MANYHNSYVELWMLTLLCCDVVELYNTLLHRCVWTLSSKHLTHCSTKPNYQYNINTTNSITQTARMTDVNLHLCDQTHHSQLMNTTTGM